jgi:predicted PurR-regulated permease PerM
VPRVISFIVLLAIVLLVGAVFFQVMAQFIVPLFLACVLLVVFQPLHAWTLRRITTHQRLSALVTTALILLSVLLPLTWLGLNAYQEFHSLLKPAESEVEVVVDSRPMVVVKETKAPDAKAAADETTGADGRAEPEEAEELDWLHEKAFRVRDEIATRFKYHVDNDEVENFVKSITNTVGAKVISGVQTAIGTLIGIVIMVIALYYFLADGPAMIRTAMYLSPLESRYEKELLNRFGDVSRAVVVATLLSAVVQGTLAGIGYFFALPPEAPIFLLTALTMVTSLVPFVGAAAVWICVCIWVYFFGLHVVDGKMVVGHPMAAIILAIYCTIFVSCIDNVIKPLILHGQSKLHPLLALLSILGGVQVLGPVGILVGPMLVSFLQALLTMLRKELDAFGSTKEGGPDELASFMEATMGVTSESVTPAVSEANVANPAPADAPGRARGKSPQSAKPTGGRRLKGKGRS